MEFLRLRLVEPMKRLADAEQLAGELVTNADGVSPAAAPHEPQKTAPDEKKSVRIAFVSDPLDEAVPADSRPAGSSNAAEELAEVLQRISKVKA
jgi:hypothetical protein